MSGILHIHLMQIAGFVGIIYMTWAIGQFFNGHKALSYVKALVAYLLGMVSFVLIIMAIGKGIDLIIRH